MVTYTIALWTKKSISQLSLAQREEEGNPPANCKDSICENNNGLSAVYVAELSVLLRPSAHVPRRSIVGLTSGCVTAPARAKPVINQVELPRSLNSDAIRGCVAITIEPSISATRMPAECALLLGYLECG